MNRKNNPLPVLILIIFLTLLVLDLSAQTSLPHYMTREEEEIKDQIGRDFYVTDPPEGTVRNIAEFEHMQGVLIRYPFGITYEVIAEMSEDVIVTTLVSNQSQENYVAGQYSSNGVNLANCTYIHTSTDSYWTRDYGPWFITYGNNEIGIVNFPYNRPRPNDDDVPIEVAGFLGIEVFGMDVIHTGGNYMTDGSGISASSVLVLDENPDLTENEIDVFFNDYLGISTYHTIPDPNNTYIDHIDCWSKFLDIDKIMIRSVPSYHAQYDEIEDVVDYFSLQTTSYGTPYEIYRVYTPSNQPYTNALILNKKVLVPITGSQWDDDAIASYEEAMPGYEILGFTGSWESTDAMHCRAKGIADNGLLYIQHFPVVDPVNEGENCLIEAEIIPYNGNPVITDSLRVYYRINQAGWNTLQLVPVRDNTYQAYIPSQMENDVVEYYIHAADLSGRSMDHPYIGSPDPHSFIVGPLQPVLAVEPGSFFVELPPDSLTSKYLYLSNISEDAVSYTIEIETTRSELNKTLVDIRILGSEPLLVRISDNEYNLLNTMIFDKVESGLNIIRIPWIDEEGNDLEPGKYNYSISSGPNELNGQFRIR